jgi:general secretion pathway protein I
VTQLRRDRGFTLIEVLVAVAIVAVALGAGLKAAGSLTNNAQRLADVSAAQWCADNQLTGLKLARQFPSVGDTEFTCEQLGRVYRGRLVVRPTPNPNFRRVDARMADDAGLPLFTLSTVLPIR